MKFFPYLKYSFYPPPHSNHLDFTTLGGRTIHPTLAIPFRSDICLWYRLFYFSKVLCT